MGTQLILQILLEGAEVVDHEDWYLKHRWRHFQHSLKSSGAEKVVLRESK